MSGSIPDKRGALTHLQQIIAALTEGIIIVTQAGTLHWADETALALHGVRALAELGGTAAGYAECFELADRSGQRLPAEEYPIQRLVRGEVIDRALLEVKRRADGRRWVHEVRTMALTDDEGAADCLVVILDDETERFNAEERFERAFAANPAPAIIVRLSDMRYVKVNHGFLELTGYVREALIGRSMHELDVLNGAARRDLAIRRLHAGQTIPQMEGCLVLPDRRERTVLLGGQPLEIGDEACMLFTFADLHPRQQAEDALRASEERFSKAFHLAPSPIAVLTLAGLRILDVNDAFTAATGWRREEVVGRSEAELRLWGEGEAREALERQIRQTGQLRGSDVQLQGKDGGLRDYLVSADTVQIGGEGCVLSVMLDITERKQTETELLAAVQSVLAESSFLGQAIVERLTALTRAKGSATNQAELASLPARAREVLELLAQGLPDDEVAKRLGIARTTLRNHIAAIYKRLGVHKRSALVVWARERGLGAPSKLQTRQPKSRAAKSR